MHYTENTDRRIAFLAANASLTWQYDAKAHVDTAVLHRRCVDPGNSASQSPQLSLTVSPGGDALEVDLLSVRRKLQFRVAEKSVGDILLELKRCGRESRNALGDITCTHHPSL